MADPKDHEAVVRFMVLYARLRKWTHDDPARVVNLLTEDDDFGALCGDVGKAASDLAEAERRERRLFAAPVDPKFVKAWRDYEQRYSNVVNAIDLAELFDVSLDVVIDSIPQEGLDERRWQLAADEAREASAAIGAASDFAKEQNSV